MYNSWNNTSYVAELGISVLVARALQSKKTNQETAPTVLAFIFPGLGEDKSRGLGGGSVELTCLGPPGHTNARRETAPLCGDPPARAR